MIAQLDQYYKQYKLKTVTRLISYFLFEGRPLTTSGRFINPFIFAGFKFIKVLPQFKKVKRPIFIIGTGRSGSTILGKLLSIHEHVGFLNEPKAIWHEALKKEDINGNYTSQACKVILNEDDISNKQKKQLNKIFGYYLWLSRSKRLLDKYPELIFRVPTVKKAFNDAQFIFLTRSANDTLKSIKLWSERKGNNVDDWWGRKDRKWNIINEQLLPQSIILKNYVDGLKQEEDHFIRAAVEWIITMEYGVKMLKKYPKDIHHIKYEDFSKKPEEEFETLYSFLDLPKSSKMEQYASNVLKPVTDKPKQELPPYLNQAIDVLEKQLGY